jgi:cytochrome P450
MSASTTDLYYDPYDFDIYTNPYPTFARLREEAPLYYNDRVGFYAVSRYADVQRGFLDRETYSSKRGVILEMIKANVEIPSGTLVSEDPPTHTIHRAIVSRVFTPKQMNALEPRVRQFCVQTLDRLSGRASFDFILDLGMDLPMRVFGMLLGVPESDQEQIRDRIFANLRTEPGKPMTYSTGHPNDDENRRLFAEYIDWRAQHPSNDLMTKLLNAEFEDIHGDKRQLTPDEVLTFTTVLAGAGNETTTNLIGWIGKVLSDHPDQRRELVDDPGLVANAVEEILRFEPPGPHVGRYVTRDVELYNQVVPEGSIMMMLVGGANRDDRHYPDPDRFDIHRSTGQYMTFGYGIHFCLGQALARLEGRVALEEVLKRFPDWEVDTDKARLASKSTLRGWETLPVMVL